MEVVERWWNGAWGRLVRRDVELARDGDRWTVTWWIGSDREHAGHKANLGEAEAQALLNLLIRWAPGPRSQWRNLGPPASREPKWD